MNDMTPTSAERAEKLEGMGCKRKRVEDIRFTQGKGNYVDDLRLPERGLPGFSNDFLAAAGLLLDKAGLDRVRSQPTAELGRQPLDPAR